MQLTNNYSLQNDTPPQSRAVDIILWTLHFGGLTVTIAGGTLYTFTAKSAVTLAMIDIGFIICILGIVGLLVIHRPREE